MDSGKRSPPLFKTLTGFKTCYHQAYFPFKTIIKRYVLLPHSRFRKAVWPPFPSPPFYLSPPLYPFNRKTKIQKDPR